MSIYKKNNSIIQQSIIKMIAFFDLFDYPLTEHEIWKYLSEKRELQDVVDELKKIDSQFNALIQKKNNFYFLKHRKNVIDEKINRHNITEKKIKQAKWICKIFKFIPWIKMIAICNIIGTCNLTEQSDIDLFIITKKNRIWTTRFFCVLILKLLWLRPKKNNRKNKICLSFFITENSMNLNSFMLDSNSIRQAGPKALQACRALGPATASDIDIYFIYWIIGLAVIYDSNNTYKEFIQANNWIKQYLPNWQTEADTETKAEAKLRGTPRSLASITFNQFEKCLKKIQLKIMPEQLKKIMNKDTRVVVNNQVIKLHLNDRRDKYRKAIKRFNIST